MNPLEPAADLQERQMAGALHVASIFFPWAAPVVGFLVAQKSDYLRFHAVKAFVDQVVAVVIIGSVTVVSLGFSIWNLYQQVQEGFQDFNIWAVVAKSAAVWLGLAAFALWNTVRSVFDARRALRSDWGGKGWVDRLARRWQGRRVV